MEVYSLFKKSLIIILTTLTLVACNQTVQSSNTTNTTNILSSDEYLELLQNAKQLEIKEEILSMGKEYNVFVDDTLVANVKGKAINVTGDLLTMTDPNGKFLIKEKQIKRWGIKFTRNGVFLNEKDEEIAYIGEKINTKLTNIGHYFHFYNEDKKEVGSSDEIVFSILKKYDFKDNKGNIDYSIKQEFGFVDTYTVTINDNSNIPILQAIIMICIQDAIKDAEESES